MKQKTLIKIDFPSPMNLRGGWAALAAICAARGWSDVAYATSDQWFYHDGGGNWACLRFKEKDKVVLLGHDHEYSETYYGKAAEFFGEEETDLLKGAPDWWGYDLRTYPFEWIGFIYGWDGENWQKVNYDKPDGFDSLGLPKALSVTNTEMLSEFASDAPGLKGKRPDPEMLEAVVVADAAITHSLLEAVIPGWDIKAGVLAAQKFLEI